MWNPPHFFRTVRCSLVQLIVGTSDSGATPGTPGTGSGVMPDIFSGTDTTKVFRKWSCMEFLEVSHSLNTTSDSGISFSNTVTKVNAALFPTSDGITEALDMRSYGSRISMPL